MFHIPVFIQTTALLVLSNVFMTFAWYGHLRHLSSRSWIVAALISWGIALFEYLLQVPANRIGFSQFSLAQLKILQETITLSVFVPFAIFLYGATFQNRLHLGGPVSAGSGLFHISFIIDLKS